MRTSDADNPNERSVSLREHLAHTYVLKLAEAASEPTVDPCDLCEEALPGYVLDELSDGDRAWIVEHTRECNYCRGELECFQQLDSLLDLCDSRVPAAESAGSTAAWSRIDSPIGPLAVAVSSHGVCEIGFGWMEDENAFTRRLIERGFVPVRDEEAVEPIARELNRFLTGGTSSFEVSVDLSGVTEFSKAVLDATSAVPFGETRTYGQIAAAIGRPGASRAVGNALNKNPVPLIVPCHRIVPAGGGIGNYAGTSRIKEQLLTIEGALTRTNPIPGFA